MKKLYKLLLSFIILVLITTTVYAHGGNISGWNNKNSDKISYYDGQYYGYHNEQGVVHYHRVKWTGENNKWEIINPSVYYEKVGEEFKLLRNTIDKELLTIDAEFVKGVDGDTADFSIDGKTIRVRFLGIDTPETVHPTRSAEPYGQEASDFTKEALANAKNIKLEFDYYSDIFYEGSDNKNRDMYNRLLAWIFVDDALLQEELLKNGLGSIYMLSNSQKYAGLLQQAEEYAKENKIGVWSNEEYIPLTEEDNHIISNPEDPNDFTEEGMIIAIVIVIIGIITYILQHFRKNKTKKKK